MRQRSLGKTGLQVSELGLGTWGLSGDGYGPVPEVEQDRVIERARALGITLFDTADSYGHGQMEERLGARLPADSGALVVTKLGTDRDSSPPRKRFDPEYLRTAVDASRKRLQRDCLDVVLLHNPSSRALQRGVATDLMKELVVQGSIRTWGVSVSDPEQANAAIERGCEVLALPYNIFLSKPLSALAKQVDEHGLGVLVHSVLAYGLLCGHWGAEKAFGANDHRSERWTPDELRQRLVQLNAVRPLVGGTIPTMRGAALRFALANQHVATAVLGPKSCLQLDQLVREAGKGPPYIPEEKLGALGARLTTAGVDS